VLLMRNNLATSIVLRHLLQLDRQQQEKACNQEGCGGFLCGRTAGCWVEGSRLAPNQVLAALVHIIAFVAGQPEGGGAQTLLAAFAPLLHQVSRRMRFNQLISIQISAEINLLPNSLLRCHVKSQKQLIS